MTQRIAGATELDDLIYPNTDARLEAALDVFEFQAISRLQDHNDPLCILFRRFWRITKYDCHRQVFDDSAVKVACRVLTLVCHSGDYRMPALNAGATPLPTGYDILPEPLRSVAHALPVGCAGKNTCDLIVAALSNIVLPQFGGLDVVVDGGNTTQGDVPSTEIEGTVDVETISPIP